MNSSVISPRLPDSSWFFTSPSPWPLFPSIAQSLDEHLHTAWSRPSNGVLVAIALVTLVFILQFYSPYYGTILPEAPIVGAKSRFEPSFITRYRFTLSGQDIVTGNWRKFQEADIPFTVLRPDSNITILPKRYTSEIGKLPMEKLNVFQSLSHDMAGDYTGFGVHNGSRLAFNVVQQRLNPRLGRGLDLLMAEGLDAAIRDKGPQCKDGWVEIDLPEFVNEIITRITTPLFVEPPLCFNSEFVRLNASFVEPVFMTAIILRQLPQFLHPTVKWCLPTYWKLRKIKSEIAKIMVPYIEARQKDTKSSHKPEDVLQYMIDGATGKENDPANLTERYIFTIIGALSTVVDVVADTMNEAITRPEYIEPLLEEAYEALKATDGLWNRSMTNKMSKMDSFMKETLRTNPASPIGHRCLVKQPITLSDGLQLPVGAYICIPAVPLPESEVPFDGFRYHNDRVEKSQPFLRQFSTTDENHAHFGTGRYACPGRYVASMEIKMVVARLLMDYEWKFPEGQGKPKQLSLLEFNFSDPKARILMREKKQ